MDTKTAKVLLIDSEEELKNLIAGVLQEWNMKVDFARTAKDAFADIDNECPDLIIMDTVLPDINCCDLCKRLRTRSNTRRIPVIMLALRNNVKEKIKYLENGADDYITRPFASSELIARIRAVMRSYQ